MKRVFALDDAIENEITGRTPQVQFDTGGLDSSVLHRLKLQSVNDILSSNIVLPPLLLNLGSRRTDWLNTFSLSAARGRLISEDFFATLQTLSLPKYEYIKVTLIGDVNYNYYFLNLSSEGIDSFINFRKSTFCLQPGKAKVTLKSIRDYSKVKSENRAAYVEWQTLRLNADIFETYDIVKFGMGRLSWFMNESTKNKLERYSGIQIVDALHLFTI